MDKKSKAKQALAETNIEPMQTTIPTQSNFNLLKEFDTDFENLELSEVDFDEDDSTEKYKVYRMYVTTDKVLDLFDTIEVRVFNDKSVTILLSALMHGTIDVTKLKKLIDKIADYQQDKKFARFSDFDSEMIKKGQWIGRLLLSEKNKPMNGIMISAMDANIEMTIYDVKHYPTLQG